MPPTPQPPPGSPHFSCKVVFHPSDDDALQRIPNRISIDIKVRFLHTVKGVVAPRRDFTSGLGLWVRRRAKRCRLLLQGRSFWRWWSSVPETLKDRLHWRSHGYRLEGRRLHACFRREFASHTTFTVEISPSSRGTETSTHTHTLHTNTHSRPLNKFTTSSSKLFSKAYSFVFLF